jgi:MtN3 and saliva related transmembrane protein
MDYTDIFGYAAAFLTTVSSIPQAFKIIRTKETKDVSTGTYLLLFTGLVLWVVYGFYRDDLPLIIANSISAIIAGTVLLLKFIPKKALNEIHDTVHKKSSSS